jgi:Icc-related predicted phosphoesterase
MKILSISDLHYSLPQFDWLVQNCEKYDLIIMAGDMMDLGSYVDTDTQASVVGQYFRKICAKVPMVVCSGNHDLVDEGDGIRNAEWLQDFSIPRLTVDGGIFEDQGLKIFSFPWWEEEEEREKVVRWLEQKHQPDSKSERIFWVHHAPPINTQVSWNGKRDLGDKSVREWIESHQPEIVFSGHIHNAPYYPDGSWHDTINRTVITNAGRQIGSIPATIVLELVDSNITWCGMEGCETLSLTPYSKSK